MYETTPGGFLGQRVCCSCRAEATTAELATGQPSAARALFGGIPPCDAIREFDRIEALPLGMDIELSSGQRCLCPTSLAYDDNTGMVVAIDGLPTAGVRTVVHRRRLA
jgi:hypothetical protein